MAAIRQQRTNRTFQSYFKDFHNEWSMGVPNKGNSHHFVLHLISNMAAKMQEFQRMIYEWYFFEDCRTYCWSIFRVISIWTHSLKAKKATYKRKHWIEYRLNGVCAWSMVPSIVSSSTFSIDLKFYNQVEVDKIHMS